jgi:hypothetical protein
MFARKKAKGSQRSPEVSGAECAEKRFGEDWRTMGQQELTFGERELHSGPLEESVWQTGIFRWRMRTQEPGRSFQLSPLLSQRSTTDRCKSFISIHIAK